MSTMYVLIYLVWGTGPLTEFSIEFDSRDACEKARVEIANMSPYPQGGMGATVCVQK